MREVKAVKINAADFAPYGTFCNMTEPEGYPLSGEIHKFYPDRISGTCVGSMAFSPIAVRKDERVVKMAEYHTTTWEGIVALDDDMIIHVAPASGRYTCTGTDESFYRSERIHGKNQCGNLASLSTSTQQ